MLKITVRGLQVTLRHLPYLRGYLHNGLPLPISITNGALCTTVYPVCTLSLGVGLLGLALHLAETSASIRHVACVKWEPSTGFFSVKISTA